MAFIVRKEIVDCSGGVNDNAIIVRLTSNLPPENPSSANSMTIQMQQGELCFAKLSQFEPG